MLRQTILTASENYAEIDEYLAANDIKRVCLVCGKAIKFLRINEYFNSLPQRTGIEIVRFSHFGSNPKYESVVEGVEYFKKKQCDALIAVGGGSAIDVAKCIKLYSGLDTSSKLLEQRIIPNKIKLMAIPTTAGSGSEATRYAVIYYNGIKQSIADDSCIPTDVILDDSTLKTLPLYQKKSTMLDALSHSMESFWSVNSTTESKAYARKAIGLIMNNVNEYLANKQIGNKNMLLAANFAGKAINISQTTAGHAMSYKVTTLFGIAHGHAAALCNLGLFPYILENIDKCIDLRGEDYLRKTLDELSISMGCKSPDEALKKFMSFVEKLELEIPVVVDTDYEILKGSVNPDRLKNTPVSLNINTIDALYHMVFNNQKILGC